MKGILVSCMTSLREWFVGYDRSKSFNRLEGLTGLPHLVPNFLPHVD